MNAIELSIVLDRHKKWLNGENGGRRAVLSNANLNLADLRYACLANADLQDAILVNANLRGANLNGANLNGANLQDAILSDALLTNVKMQAADLSYADLRYANLRNADLRSADLREANLREAINVPDLSWTSIVPKSGSFTGWKKVYSKKYNTHVIIKLEILANAKRCNATGRKCRCSAAKVLEIQKLDGTPTRFNSVENTKYKPHVTYTVGETVLPDNFDDDRWNECSHGIHFFITRQEAVDYY